jgi:vacuolar-type H+-ATPase subunit E/Vma4
MITETEIVQHAKAEAERILQQASEQANALVAQANEGALETTNAAKNYVDSILYQVEVNLDKITSSVKKTRDDWQKSNDEAK